jgi:hypothetical protein
MVNTSGIISTVTGNGTSGYSGDGGAATSAALYLPLDEAVDGSGNLYIVDGPFGRESKSSSWYIKLMRR